MSQSCGCDQFLGRVSFVAEIKIALYLLSWVQRLRSSTTSEAALSLLRQETQETGEAGDCARLLRQRQDCESVDCARLLRPRHDCDSGDCAPLLLQTETVLPRQGTRHAGCCCNIIEVWAASTWRIDWSAADDANGSSQCQLVWARIRSCQIVSDRIRSCQLVSARVSSYQIVSDHVTSYQIVSDRVSSCQLISDFVRSCRCLVPYAEILCQHRWQVEK